MRTLTLHFPDDALPTLESFLKQTKEARIFRRAQAVRDVVQGRRLQTVSDTLHFTYSALRKWVHRFAHQGSHGLVDRPRPGRPPQVTCALAQHLERLVDEAPLQQQNLQNLRRNRIAPISIPRLVHLSAPRPHCPGATRCVLSAATLLMMPCPPWRPF